MRSKPIFFYFLENWCLKGLKIQKDGFGTLFHFARKIVGSRVKNHPYFCKAFCQNYTKI